MPGVDPVTGTIYTQEGNDTMVAITPAGDTDWTFYIGTNSDSTPVAGADGTVYFGADDGKLYAVNPEDRRHDYLYHDRPFPTDREWTFQTGNPASPPQVDTTPAIAPDGTILVVSNDNYLYALNQKGTLNWRFPIPVNAATQPISSPTVDEVRGVVYTGSSDTQLYAVKSDLALPRNLKENLITSVYEGGENKVAGETVTVGNTNNWLAGDTSGSDPKGPWAVRLEVMRNPDQNAYGKYEYTLHAWIRQVDPAANPIFRTFFEDTRVEYAAEPHLAQTIELTPEEDAKFTDTEADGGFIFGFTGATGSGGQSAQIAKFQLSFIRVNDPIVGD
jgi:hypothetical protein